MGSVSRVTSIYATYAGHNTPLDHGWRPDPKGTCHRHLQDRWWALLDLWHCLLVGPTIDVLTIGGGRFRIFGIASQGARHRCLKDRWSVLLDLRYSRLGGPPCDILQLRVTHSQTSGNTFERATLVHTTSRTFFSKKKSRILVLLRTQRDQLQQATKHRVRHLVSSPPT
jgi:hypothetical protein